MNTATLAIPRRWQEAAFRIKRYVEEQAEGYGTPLSVILVGEIDAGQIYIVNDTLSQDARRACETAVASLNSQLNARISEDPWAASDDLAAEHAARSKEFDELFDKLFPPKI